MLLAGFYCEVNLTHYEIYIGRIMSTSTASNAESITLNPWDGPNDIITLKVPKQNQVNVLRPMIKKWWAYRFKDIDQRYRSKQIWTPSKNYSPKLYWKLYRVYKFYKRNLDGFISQNFWLFGVCKDLSDSNYEGKKDPGTGV
jgi:hypothetical protein